MNHRKRLRELCRHAVGAAVIAMALGRAGVLRADEKTANTRPVGERIEPFKIAVEDTVLRDLQDRLAARTRDLEHSLGHVTIVNYNRCKAGENVRAR